MPSSGRQIGDHVHDHRRLSPLQLFPAGRAGQHPGHQAGSRPQAGLHVARGVPRDGELADRSPAEPQQRGQRQVGPRPAAARVRGRERQVDQRPPVQRVEQGIPGDRGESGGQADPDPGRPQRGEGLGRARQRNDGAGPHRRGIVLLEGSVRLLRGILGAEDVPEHLDLGLAHGLVHEGQRLVVARRACRQPELLGRGGERSDDAAVIGHRGAGHVQAGDGDRHLSGLRCRCLGRQCHRYQCHGCQYHANVSSAIAGAQVMPRPPGPVTRTTPGAISDR